MNIDCNGIMKKMSQYYRILFLMASMCCALPSMAGQMQMPTGECRDSLVVDSITGDTRKYKLTDNKALKPLYWVYNFSVLPV